MKTVYTNCRICLANCGIEVTVGEDNRVTRIAPDKENPYTWRDFAPRDDGVAEASNIPGGCCRRCAGSVIATWKPPGRKPSPTLPGDWEHPGSRRPRAIGTLHRATRPASPSPSPSSRPVSSTASAPAIATTPTLGRHQLPPRGDRSALRLAVVRPRPRRRRVPLLPPRRDQPAGERHGLGVPTCQTAGAASSPPRPRGPTSSSSIPGARPTAEKADTISPLAPGRTGRCSSAILKVIFDKDWEHQDACAGLVGHDALRDLAAEADLEDLDPALRHPARRNRRRRPPLRPGPYGSSAIATRSVATHHRHPGRMVLRPLNLVTGRIDRPGGRRFERGYVKHDRPVG